MILALDCSYLCRRALYSTGQFSHNGESTGVLYGFLRDLLLLQFKFQPVYVAFCFDSKTSRRQEVNPGYKAHRSNYIRHDPDEWKDEMDYRRQVDSLRENILYEIGFKNVLHQEGYEADDIIAKVTEIDNTIMVSADEDLFQLLNEQRGRPRVQQWIPRKELLMKEGWFQCCYGIDPKEWVMVKCIAGCASDHVLGVKGVGEKTAIKYLKGQLGAGHKAYAAIQQASETIHNNRILVELPFPGCKDVKLAKDKVNEARWEKVLRRMGMKSLFGIVPGHRRRRVEA